MKSTIQLISISIALLLLAVAITYSSTPQAEILVDGSSGYWHMLGNYQTNTP